MIYEIELKPRAIRDLKSIDRTMARRITEKIVHMKEDLAGDVKRLTTRHPSFGCALAIIEFYSKSKAIR